MGAGVRRRFIAAAAEREMEHAMSGRLRAALLVTGVLGLGLVGAAAAHDSGSDGFRGHGRWSTLTPEDRAAFADARIAGLHAGLKLNADQEKLWPPVEAALRDRPNISDDAPAALRAMADAATARGEALRKLADVSQPLYASLDEGQKRRAMILARPMGDHRHGGWHRHRDDARGPGDDDR
jgi:zinc resistance-associated protein